LKQSEAKAKKYIECLNENRRQHALLQDKIKELDIAKSELAKLREVADRTAKINQSNSDLVIRKCALEV